MLLLCYLEKIQTKHVRGMHRQLVLKVLILLQRTGKVLHLFKA